MHLGSFRISRANCFLLCHPLMPPFDRCSVQLFISSILIRCVLYKSWILILYQYIKICSSLQFNFSPFLFPSFLPFLLHFRLEQELEGDPRMSAQPITLVQRNSQQTLPHEFPIPSIFWHLFLHNFLEEKKNGQLL